MAGLHELIRATLNIGRDDTGAGGLVLLHGKPKPIVRWGDPVQRDPPATAFSIVNAPRRRGIPDGWDVTGQFTIVAPLSDDGKADAIAERLHVWLTGAKYKAKGVDTTVSETSRRPGSTLVELGEGEVALTVDYRFRLAR